MSPLQSKTILTIGTVKKTIEKYVKVSRYYVKFLNTVLDIMLKVQYIISKLWYIHVEVSTYVEEGRDIMVKDKFSC